MRATFYSLGFCHYSKPSLLVCFAVFSTLFSAFGETNSIQQVFEERTETAFRAAQKASRSQSRDNGLACEYARIAFDYAEFAKKNDRREQIANEGIYATREVIAREYTNAAAHYYLAMNLAQVARTKLLGALKLVNEMEREFGLAGSLDNKFDDAGPDRNLGLIYSDAPGWPTSIGSRSKAKQCLERAVALAPGYPENHLHLLDAYLKWGEKKNIQRELKATEELWPKAKKEFTGQDWESYWADWDAHWQKTKNKIVEIPKTLSSPANKK